MERRAFVNGAMATGLMALSTPSLLSAQARPGFTRSNLTRRSNALVHEAVYETYYVVMSKNPTIDIDVFLARACPFSQRLFAFLQRYRGKANIIYHLDPVQGDDPQSLLYLWQDPKNKNIWNYENVRRYLTGTNFRPKWQTELQESQAIANFNWHLKQARLLDTVQRGTPKVIVNHGGGSYFLVTGFNETTRAILAHYA